MSESLRERKESNAGTGGLAASAGITLGLPPIITHTAATPQGSPNATLEPSRSFQTSPLALHIQAASLCSINQTFENYTPPGSTRNVASLSVPSNHFVPQFLQRRRSSAGSVSGAASGDSLAVSTPGSRRGSCLSAAETANTNRVVASICRIQRRGSNTSRRSSHSHQRKKSSDRQILVSDERSDSDTDSETFDNSSDRRHNEREGSVTTEADVNHQSCNGD
ncbi:unnamed protein product, partial [Medioppia subpectinata]